ncbi:hypothetical protein N7G274_009785 [Stereocaulon virgatum]|uniref:Uncharacterized protein n=1 Tax=Stereocaulon virgatum TaxID=373712 RepID=A0ABR3ZY81_9LECA
MAKSLDGLIRHLLDQIALCGEHGALPSDFITYVKGYYAEQSKETQHADGDSTVSSQKTTPNIDRPFLEHVWKWITKDPEIRVGDHAGHKRLTLSEVEARNAAIQQQDQISSSVESPASKDGAPTSLPSSQKSQKFSGNGQASESSQARSAAKVPVTPTKNLRSLPVSTFQPGTRLYTSENRMWYALTGHGPDLGKIKALDFVALSIIAACGPKGILQHDLTRISGQDKRSLPARTDRLHDSGYIVKERLMTDDGTGQRMIHTSRCTLARYAKSTPNQPEQPAGPLTKEERRREQKRKRKRKNVASSNVVTSSPAAKIDSNQNPSLEGTQFVPQWSSDRSVNNHIFDLVDQAGTQGMSMNELRGRLFGGSVKKVTEDYVSRLVECWQLSQPLHLRHLSIVRDTLLRGKSQIYIYYSYNNFKKLVEAGTGFWEAVTPVPDTVRQGNNVAASLSALPDIDEHGFPKLDMNQFQGRHNDATPGECVSALNAGSFRLSGNDPFLQKQVDGTSVLKYKASRNNHSDEPCPRKRADSPAHHAARKPHAIHTFTRTTPSPSQHESMEPQNIGNPKKRPQSPIRDRPEEFQSSKKLGYLTTQVDLARAEAHGIQSGRYVVRKSNKRTGRPRKYPKSGIPDNIETMSPSEIKKLRDSQEMAEKYERSKIEYEITERIKDGEDPAYVTQDVLSAADILRKQDGREPLPSFPRAQVLHQFAGGPMPEPIDTATGNIGSMLPSSYLLPRRGTGRRRKKGYWPSMAAHTIWLPTPSKIPNLNIGTEEPSKDVKILSGGLRDQDQCQSALMAPKAMPEAKPDLPYLPSVAAHSWPHLSNLVSKTEVSQTKRSRGRPRNPNKQAVPSPKANQHAVPSAVVRSPLNTPTRAATIDLTRFNPGMIDEGAYPGWIKFMSKYYQDQLESIARPRDGVFYGPTKPRRKRQCEPPDLRPREYKVVIFKLARLHEFDWFVTQPQALGPVPSLDRRDQESLALVVESRPPEPRQSLTNLGHDLIPPLTEIETPSRTCPVPLLNDLGLQPDTDFQQPPFVDHIIPGATSGYVSPYAKTTGAKRKRGTSPHPNRGRPPPPPAYLLRNSHSNDLNPEAQPLVTTVKIGAHAEADRTSEDVHKACDETTVEAPNVNERIPNDGSNYPIIDRSVSTTPPSTNTAGSCIPIEQSASNGFRTPTSTQKRSGSDVGTVEPQIKNSFNRVSRLGGSVAMLRKNIVMDLVEKCHGIFSGSGEMVTPFTVEWSKRGLEGNPEKRTVQNAVNNLCAEGKLRRITFTYQNKHGIVATKTMFTLASIDPADSRVKEMQTRMIAYHPRYYVPEGVMRAEDQHATSLLEKVDASRATDGRSRTASELSPADLKRLNWGRKMTEGKDQVVEARLEALRAQERGEMQHRISLGTDRSSQSDSDSRRRPRMLFIPPDPPPKPVGRPKGSTEDFQQWSSMEKIPDETVVPPLPLPRRSSAAVDGMRSLTWLSSEYAFSEFNFENRRPTLLQPTIDKHIRNAYARYGRKLDLSRSIQSLSKSNNHPNQRMRAITENAARIERMQKEAKAARPSLLFSDSRSSPFEPPYARVCPPSSKNVEPQSKPKETGQDQTAPKQTLSTPAGGSGHSESTLILQSSETPQFESVEHPDLSKTQDMQPDRKRHLLVGFMDPVHHFNSSNGTFSVSFSGINPPSKHVAWRGTALCPYTHTLRPVTPFIRKRKRLASIVSPQELLPRTTGRFEDDINLLLDSELSVEGLQDALFPDWPIINHVFPHSHTTAETIGAVANDYSETAEFSHPVKKRKYVRSRIGHSILNAGNKDISPAAAQALKRIQINTPLKRRRLTSLVVNHSQDDASSPVQLGSDSRPTKFRRVRGPRRANLMGEEGEKRLLTAVVAIRTLTGGLEQHIDWVLIAKAFEGTHEQMFLRSRWGHIREKNKLLMPKLEKDFQTMFPKAYEEGKVPSIDFENLAAYDWKALIDWTLDSLSTDLQSRPELPADRNEFDDVYTLDEASEEDISGFYEIDAPSNTARRTSIVNRGAYQYPSNLRTKLAPPGDREQIATAKTWVRANVITPEDTYNGVAARDKLSIFPVRVIEDALKEMLIDRVLMQENKGRLIPGRNYDVSEHLISRLKKNLLPAHFQRALAYKKQLDLDFEETGSALYSLTADDGDILAIINMVAEKRITLTPISIPAKKWGLTDGSYETRQMDKKLLNFDIELRPLPAYIEGIPLSPFPPPPSHHLQNPDAKIPLWYDIHDHLVPVMWEMVVAAILAVLAVRSGISAMELERAFRPAIDVWEIELVLEWLVAARAVRKVGRGWAVCEWWWLALGSVEEVRSGFGEGLGRDKGKGRA